MSQQWPLNVGLIQLGCLYGGVLSLLRFAENGLENTYPGNDRRRKLPYGSHWDKGTTIFLISARTFETGTATACLLNQIAEQLR